MQILHESLRNEIKIVNVVCTADLKQPVDIGSFNKYKFLSSNLDLYRCGYVKDDMMTGRVTVFASGKLISVGTKSPAQAHEELETASKILRHYKLIKFYKLEPKVQNIVANAFLEKHVSLDKLSRTLPRSMYEPEQFPGLVYRIVGSGVALIFASGKVVIVGSKSIEEVNSVYFELTARI